MKSEEETQWEVEERLRVSSVCDVNMGKTEDYQALLHEARSSDLSDLERYQVIQAGLDCWGTRVVIFMPRLGFHDAHDSISQLRRMLLLFIKKAHEIVSSPYVFVYDHMPFSIFSQQPLIYRTYSMLPRAYKKNIRKLYVIHPTFLIRVFFEQGVKYFVSQKFYNKLKFVDSVMELQRLIFPLGGTLPAAYLKRGDEKKSAILKPSFDPAFMPPLEVAYNSHLETTNLIHQCMTFLKMDNSLKTEGIFRLAGDQAVLDLAQARLFGRLEEPPTVVIGADAYNEIGLVSLQNTKSEISVDQKPTSSYSTLMVTDVHTVTSILGMSLRHLPVSLIIPDVHTSLLELTKKYHKDQNLEEWYGSVIPLLNSMPESHAKTLQILLSFLAQVSMESATNEMTVENISRVFAPSLFPEKPLDEANPMLAFAEVQLQKEILIKLITKHMQEEESLVANVNLSTKMMSRLRRNEEDEEDDISDEDSTK